MKKFVLTLLALISLSIAARGQQLVSATPAPFVGISTTVTFTVANAATSLNQYYFAFMAPAWAYVLQPNLLPSNACAIDVIYWPGASRAVPSPDQGGYAFGDLGRQGAGLESGYSSPATVANSFCTIHSMADGSRIQANSDGSLTIVLRIDFSAATYNGVKNLYWGYRTNTSGGPYWSSAFVQDGAVASWYVGSPGGGTTGGAPTVSYSNRDDYPPTSSFTKPGIWNLALGRSASQSSTPGWWGYNSANSATDGSTYGVWTGAWNNSVTHTDADSNAWWQVDLGASGSISSITIWGRSDCCLDRLSDYWVFVSDAPFAAGETPATLQSRAGTWSNHQTSIPMYSTSIPVNASGRYVRVQLSGTNYLALAEVQVFGTSPLNNFFVTGESYARAITGPPSAAVSVARRHNGADGGTLSYTLDGNGSLTINGSFGAGDLGFWTEIWTIGGVATPMIRYSVAPGNTALSKFTITNTTRGGNTAFFVGDSYHIDMYGPPNSQGRRQGVQNGPPTGGLPYTLGGLVVAPLDYGGHWYYDGVVASGEVSAWTVNWCVDGVPAGAPLEYVIQ